VPILFELVFFGGVTAMDDTYLWNPKSACICIEVASGLLIERVRVCKVLAQRQSVVSNTSFASSPEALEAGMGPQFHSVRSDKNDNTKWYCDTCRFSRKKDNFILW
jgi:hypothetical protein